MAGEKNSVARKSHVGKDANEVAWVEGRRRNCVGLYGERVGGWVEEKGAVGIRCWTLWVGGWVGGRVGG